MTWWCAVDHKPFLLPTVFYHMILVVSVTMSSSFSRTGHAFKKVFLKPNLTFFLPKPSHSLHFVGKSSVFTITKAPLSFEFWLSKWVLLIFFLSLSLVVKVDELKYLGSAIEGNRQCTREVKKRVKAGQSGWRRLSGVICDRQMAARLKKVCKVVKPAMMYCLEMIQTLRKSWTWYWWWWKRFSLWVPRMDKTRGECIRGTGPADQFGDKVINARQSQLPLLLRLALKLCFIVYS